MINFYFISQLNTIKLLILHPLWFNSYIYIIYFYSTPIHCFILRSTFLLATGLDCPNLLIAALVR